MEKADLAEPLYIIETDLTSEERQIIVEGSKRYHDHPEEFISLESLMQEQ